VLIVTGPCIQIYPRNYPKVKASFPFLTLTALKCHESTISLGFGERAVTVGARDSAEAETALRSALEQFMTPRELEKFGLAKPRDQSGFAVVSRLSAGLELADISLSKSLHTLLERAILYRWPHLALPPDAADAAAVALRILPISRRA